MSLFKVLLVILSTFSLLFSSPSTSASSRPEIAEQVKAWSGGEGVQVWILRYGQVKDNLSLVQITGIDHEWNKKIFLMKVESRGDRKYYYITVNDKRYNVLVFMEYNYAELYIPYSKNEKITSLRYDNNLSLEGNAQYFLTDYLEQDITKD